MPFNDFDVFWRAARALLDGHDPYALPGVYYPLPSFFLFLPLAAIPLPLAHVVWTAIEALIFVAILRLRAISAMLFMPVLLTFLMGQMVMPMLGVFALLCRVPAFGGIALGLLMLKPQLVVFVAPWLLWQWWRNDRRQIVWFCCSVALMTLVAFAAEPDWVSRWLAVSGERVRAPISPSIWGLGSFLPAPVWIGISALVTVGVFIWAWRQNNLDILMAASMLVNPVLITYDQTLLTVLIRSHRFWLIITLLSWILFAVSAWLLNERWGVLIPLAVIVFQVRQKQKRLA